MKKLLLFVLAITPFFVSAQEIRYDTIRVAANDDRNIHRNQQQNSYSSLQSTKPLRVKPSEKLDFDKSKLRFGANLGLSLSRNYTVFGLGPKLGYQFTDMFMAGAGVKYYYTKVGTYDFNIKNNLLGADVFGYFYPIRFITLFAQPEINYIWTSLEKKSSQEYSTEKGFVPSLIVGGGLRLGRSHITLNYDLVQNSRSPYPDGFYLGFSTFF